MKRRFGKLQETCFLRPSRFQENERKILRSFSKVRFLLEVKI